MQMNYSNSKKVSSFILCMVLMVAMALSTVGCNGSKNSGAASGAEGTQAGADVQREGGELGEGSKEFAFTVADKEGNETHLTIRTDQEIVGDALQELGVIDGEEGEYGLYVKTVNGIKIGRAHV